MKAEGEMVDVETAVKIATIELKKVMPEFAALSPHIEEFQRSSDSTRWSVTFRVRNPDADFTKNLVFPYRDKLVEIDAGNGELIAIRNPTYD